jgi:hypothetical protein
VQDHAADELDVEVPLPERALGRLPAGGEGAHQDVVERGAAGDLLLERRGARPQRIVRQPFELALQRVDLRHPRQIALDPPLVR